MNLRTHRERACLTQTQLAERAGCSQGRISQLETGQLAPKHYSTAAVRIAAALRVPLEDVIAPPEPPAPFARSPQV